MVSIDERPRAPRVFAIATIALMLGGLLIGFEPVIGDPDCLYRPIKTELAKALARGTLPFWSDRFALGVPLVAESHASAFYPLNWFAYEILEVSSAYRLMMWLHYLAIAAGTFAYARVLGLTPWGSTLASISFTLCGFQASHACHEPFYHVLAYLPLSLYLVERFFETKKLAWIGGLALALGVQYTLGHFQIQMWTTGLVLLTAAVRAFQQMRSGLSKLATARLLSAVAAGVCLAVLSALPQLGLTFELTRTSNFNRPAQFLSNYSFPLTHWAQPILPTLFNTFKQGNNSAYWPTVSTTADEACFYVGTIPLILACVGMMRGRDRALGLWSWIGLISFVVATMPSWWREGFMILLKLPGIGHFRAPGRYTLLSSMALCLLAGRGFDLATSSRSFRQGIGVALILSAAGFAWGYAWSRGTQVSVDQGELLRSDHLRFSAICWGIGLLVVSLWRGRRLPHWTLCIAVACELGFLYYRGPTHWGRPVDVEGASPVFQALKKEDRVSLVAGELQDLPVRVGLNVAYPNLGIIAPPPNYLLESSMKPELYVENYTHLTDRYGVSHGIFEGTGLFRPSKVLYHGPDPVLDALLPSTRTTQYPRYWRVERYPPPFPFARAASTLHIVPDWLRMLPALMRSTNPDDVWYLSELAPVESGLPRARSAKVIEWTENEGTIEHDGECDLVLRRTIYPGWTASINGGPEVPFSSAEGGLQSLRIRGRGRSTVKTYYRPTRLGLYLTISATAIVTALSLIASEMIARRRVKGFAS